MEFHGVPWIIHGNPMELHGVPWNSMDFHGIPWSSIGLFYTGSFCISLDSAFSKQSTNAEGTESFLKFPRDGRSKV